MKEIKNKSQKCLKLKPTNQSEKESAELEIVLSPIFS